MRSEQEMYSVILETAKEDARILAKGLWREEIPSVQDMANGIVRPEVKLESGG